MCVVCVPGVCVKAGHTPTEAQLVVVIYCKLLVLLQNDLLGEALRCPPASEWKPDL